MRPIAASRQQRSEGEAGSAHGSPLSTPSPGHRTMSMSPTAEMATMNALPHQYISNTSVPAHLRGDMHAPSPTSTTSSGYNSIRPTSHPTTFPPPSTLEPSIEPQNPSSAAGSPHMSSVGWQSPSHAASPTHGSSYVYPDPEYQSASMGPLFYQNAVNQARRTGSAEPGTTASYEVKPRQSELWAAAQ